MQQQREELASREEREALRHIELLEATDESIERLSKQLQRMSYQIEQLERRLEPPARPHAAPEERYREPGRSHAGEWLLFLFLLAVVGLGFWKGRDLLDGAARIWAERVEGRADYEAPAPETEAVAEPVLGHVAEDPAEEAELADPEPLAAAPPPEPEPVNADSGAAEFYEGRPETAAAQAGPVPPRPVPPPAEPVQHTAEPVTASPQPATRQSELLEVWAGNPQPAAESAPAPQTEPAAPEVIEDEIPASASEPRPSRNQERILIPNGEFRL